MSPKSLLDGLYQHYTAPLEAVFPQFKLGAVIFFVGMVVLYGANQLMTPSLGQELVTLAALIITGGGFIITMMAQVRILIGRILILFKGKS